MTVPVERTRAIQNVHDFLVSLLDPKTTPRVPKEIRRRAGSLLKHYPTGFDLMQLAKALPDKWGPPRRDRMFAEIWKR